MKWTSVKDHLPIVPEGKRSVLVLCAVLDPVYAELSGEGYGYDMMLFDGERFYTIALPCRGGGWQMLPSIDPVTHWLMPEAPGEGSCH